MKTKFALIVFFMLILVACGDDESSAYKCEECVDTPEALPANDASGKGIYKGFVIGSSGNIKFNISNNGATIDAILTLDGEEYPLHTSAGYDLGFGFEGYFYGTKNTTDDIEIGFYVNADGLEYGIFNVTIPGHSEVTIKVYKELSTALVAVYEGKYEGDAEGTFNLMVRDNIWEVAARDDDGFEDYFEGTIVGDELDCNCGDVQVFGSLDGDEVNGEWSVQGSTENGTWKGKRTL